MRILLYGATGTIADSVFKIVKENQNKLKVVAATCNTNFKKLEKLRIKYGIKKIGINNHKSAEKYKSFSSNINNRHLFIGNDSFSKLITKDIDTIILAVSGLSALNISYDIAKSGKTIGLANKECIISLGPRLLSLAKKNKTKIIPLDSEHNAIFRLLETNDNRFKSITLTASGGPFLNKKISFMKNVTPKQAIRHPIWKMGKKISVDSSTMMNKALEIIEAKYLFDLNSDQINAIIHPESVIHAAINFYDNSSIGLLSKPDMKIPISYLLKINNNKNKSDNIFQQLNKKNLTFYKINQNKFPAIKLAYKVMKIGGLAPHIFNYNNEILVDNFLQKKIKFLDIVKYNEITLNKFLKNNKNIVQPNLKDIHDCSMWINQNIFLGKKI
tara:strand:- start:6252 stop:7409 length:1158 start_codon:yes stop_codon:yes gene_type:complete